MMTQNTRRRGFTLAEVLIAMFITSLIIAGVSQSYLLIYKNFFAVGNYVDLSAQSRMSIELFGRDMRMASRVWSATSTVIDVDIQTPSGSVGVTYTYDPTTKEFTRTSQGQTRTILKNCDALALSYFDITGQPTTTALAVKKVQLNAITRRWVQNMENTDHLITATYMMRNRRVAN